MNRSAQPLPSGDLCEGRGAFDTQERQLVLEDGGHVLTAVIVADGKSSSHAVGERAEILAHALTEWFERLEAGAVAGGVDADALGIVVVDGDEYRDLAFASPGRGYVGAPHGVQRVRDDGAVVVARAAGRADPRGCHQGVLAHQSQHSVPGGADAGKAQAGPYLAIAFALERAGGEDGPDPLDQSRIRHRSCRSARRRGGSAGCGLRWR